MMSTIEWIFSGIGTQILFFIITLIIGGAIGYSIGIKVKNKQTQKAGDNSNQSMIGNTTNINGHK